MLDRLGSNLDRAVLLGDLLRNAGHTVRLAHAELPERRAQELLAKVRPIPDQRFNPAATKSPSPDRKRLIEGVMPGYAESEPQRLSAAQRLEDEARALVNSRADELQAATRDLASGTARSEDQAALAALRDHWWVERKEGNDWIAMDVLLPDAKPGDALAAAAKFSEWKPDASDPSVPSTEWHTVQVRVVIERYEGGATTESTVLDTTLRPASVFDRPLSLRHLPLQWPDNLPGPETDPNALGNAAINVREWVPLLEIGDEALAQSGFTDSGDLVADPLNPQRDIAEAGGAGFMSGFGEALGGGETSASSLTAEWIDYEIRVPGEQTQRIRRPIFDLLGPVQRSAKAEGFDASANELLIRRSEALVSQIDIFLQPCEITVEFAAHLASASIVAHQAAIRELAAEPDPAKARDMALALFGKIDVWSPLPQLARWRSALGDQPANWFVDRPNVLSYRVSPPVVNADREATRELIDIASNAVGVRQGAGRNAFQVRLRQGVADTVAELVVLGGDLRGSENTASLFSMATQGNASAFIRPHELTAVRDLGWSEDAAARLAMNLEAGYAAVALRQPVELDGLLRSGWWRVDPASGETIGVMDTGFHAGQADYQATNLAANPALNRNWMSAIIQQESNRGMQQMTRVMVPILVAKLVGGLALVAFSD
jgi:hypothetical protein